MQIISQINAVFSDLDGTLLTTDKKITPDTQDAIEQLNDQNIPFVLSSARPPAAIEPIVETYDLDCCMIAFSGGLILDEHRNILYQKGFPLSEAIQIKNYIENYLSDVTWNIYTQNDWIVKDLTAPDIINEATITKVDPIDTLPETLAPDTTVFKIMCMCDPEKLDSVEKHLKKVFPKYSIAKSYYNLLEIMQTGVNKAEAIHHFCSVRNIPLDSTIAFGDNYNDLEMLHTVGHSVVMGNAPEEIRKQFLHVTDDNEHDGIARALELLGLVSL